LVVRRSKLRGERAAASRRTPEVAMTILCAITLFVSPGRAESQWTEISSALLARLTNNGPAQPWPGGCSGVVVNRTNGDVTIKVVGLGLWRSSDQGGNWRRIDGNTVSGRDETGWATTANANAPTQIASFSLDGTAGWSPDGATWRKFADLGRNWDYGSVDWSAPEPRTIIAARHETTPPGEVYLTQDGGLTWHLLSIHLNAKRDQVSMVGALGAKALIYSAGDGIHRSVDDGLTWAKVSAINPQTRLPVLLGTAHYLGSANGLQVSADRGATWRQQGAAVNVWLGPFFGRDEKEILVVGKDGVFVTRNSGESWTRVAGLKPKERGFEFTPNWFGCYAWDPLKNVLYASAMGNPVFKLEL
jgi:hypothetical protein